MTAIQPGDTIRCVETWTTGFIESGDEYSAEDVRHRVAYPEVCILGEWVPARYFEKVDTEVARLRAKLARVEALAATDGIWKGEKHVRLTRRDPRLGCDITESYVRVDDLRAALAEEP